MFKIIFFLNHFDLISGWRTWSYESEFTPITLIAMSHCAVMQDKHISRKLQAPDEICQLITTYMLRSAWINTNLSSSLILNIQTDHWNA